ANSPQGTVADGGTVATGAELDTVVNYNLQKASTSDDVSDTQANLGDWSLSVNGTAGPGWQLATDDSLFGGSVFGSGQYWFGPDNDHPSDITLASPEVDVASDSNFTLAFDHFYDMEFAGFDGAGTAYGFDGGVIEVSTDGGKTWKDAFSTDIGGQVTTGQGYDGLILSLSDDGTFDPSETSSKALHAGFIAENEDPNNPVLEHVVINFGNTLKGQKVQVRFREVTDEATGVFGWVVDNITFGGITNLPFSITVPDAGAAAKVPTADAGPAQTVQTGATVTLDGSKSSDPYNTALTYAWTQTGGPTVSLNGANTVNPTFVPTFADQYSFQLVVTDKVGRSSAPASVSITVGSHGGGDSGGAFGLWLLLPGFALAGLRRRKRS
ncbi:MAG: PKD domain-containing protein, partial [Nevskiales bacterium]